MIQFFVKWKEKSTQCFSIEGSPVEQNGTEYAFSAALDYGQVEYVEVPLQKEDIRAGDDGFYFLPAGLGGCANTDFGIGSFQERPDSQLVIFNAFFAVYGFKHFDLLRTVIVTGMRHDVRFVIEVREGKYYLSLRFCLGGEAPYEPIRLQIHDRQDPEGDYCHMARIYREYQLRHGFRTLRQRLNPTLAYAVESPNIRVRMGWKPVPCKVTHQTLETEPPMHVACTFSDLIALMDEFKAVGLEKAEICLVGWNIRGHDGRWPQVLPVEEALGGEEGLRRAIAHAEKLGYRICCHTNSTDAYTIADCFDEQEMIRKKDGGTEKEPPHWSGGQTYHVCPRMAYETSDRHLQPVKELGFQGTHYIDVITCVPARNCFHPAHPQTKQQGCDSFERLFEKARTLFGAVSSEGAYDHTLRQCDSTLYVSFQDYQRAAAQKEPGFFERAIPFYQLVYHGIVLSNPYCRTVNAILADTKEDLLKVIEYGGRPQMYFYAQFVDDGSNWIGKGDFYCHTPEERRESALQIQKTMEIWKDLHALQYEFMETHRMVSEGVYEVTYSDGSRVTVDYPNNTWSLQKADS